MLRLKNRMWLIGALYLGSGGPLLGQIAAVQRDATVEEPALEATADLFNAARGATFVIDGNVSDTTLSLFAGDFLSPLDGELVLARALPTATNTNATDTSATTVHLVRIVVRKAVLLATQWDPANNLLPEPSVLSLDPRFLSSGVYDRRTGAVRFSLYLRGTCGGAPVPMPLYLHGALRNGRLRVAGDNGPVSDASMSVSISAHGDADRPEIRFSTEIGFTTRDDTGVTPGWVSDGDVLGAHSCVILDNAALTSRLGIMPIVPDLGLDALTWTTYRPVLFSLEDTVWSETLGRLGHGDLLAVTGQIVRTNAELIAAFGPNTGAVADVGLDAVHIPTAPLVNVTSAGCCNPMILFSVESRFFSAALQRWIGHGDLLSSCGQVWRTNWQLLRNFDPIAVPCLTPADCPDFDLCGSADEPVPAVLVPCVSDTPDAYCIDFGLDGVFVQDHGEIWFSTETGFWDANLGWVSGGDVLSSRGYVVRRNRALVDHCDPLMPCRSFGLDALDWQAPAANVAAEPLDAAAPLELP